MKPSRSRNAIDESLLCQFPFSDGRACRMLRDAAHPTLCSDHARREPRQQQRRQRARDLADISSELVSLYSGLHSAAEIQRYMGRLLLLAATDRIRPRIAASLAHRVQLLLDNRAVRLMLDDVPTAARKN
jgi:hypothetical protein